LGSEDVFFFKGKAQRSEAGWEGTRRDPCQNCVKTLSVFVVGVSF